MAVARSPMLRAGHGAAVVSFRLKIERNFVLSYIMCTLWNSCFERADDLQFDEIAATVRDRFI